MGGWNWWSQLADHEPENEISWSQLQLDPPTWGERDPATHQPQKIWHLSISAYFTCALGAVAIIEKVGPRAWLTSPAYKPSRDNAKAAASEPSLFTVKCHFLFFLKKCHFPFFLKKMPFSFHLKRTKNLASLIDFDWREIFG